MGEVEREGIGGEQTSGSEQNHYMYKILKQQKVTSAFFYAIHQYIVTIFSRPSYYYLFSHIYFLPVKCRLGLSLNL